MAYKRYIKRGNKIYGPYLYHSKKINGSVKSEYLGKYEKKQINNKTLLTLLAIFISAVLLLSIFFMLKGNLNQWVSKSLQFTGFATFNSWILSDSFVNPSYYNQTDGFSVIPFGLTAPTGITSNASDLWILDQQKRNITHTTLKGVYQAGGFSTIPFGASDNYGITTNGSDFWFVDREDDFVYHTDALGNNMTDGFKLHSGDFRGITTNDSDFWITDISGNVYHYNALGVNQTDGFKVSTIGCGTPRGLTTNGSDFWIVDTSDYFIYHTNSTGGNMSDGFSTSVFGSNNPYSITTNTTTGTPTDFWIVDDSDDFVYHLGLTDKFSPTITPAFPLNGSTIYSTSLTYDINFTISDESFDTLWYSNNSGVTNTTLANKYGNITQVTWLNGINNLTIWANDSGNNIGTASLTFFIKNSTDVDTCGYLMITNKTYDLQNSVSSSGTCFTILANNITINCKNNAINYGSSTTGETTGFGVYNWRYNFTNISNCIINEVSLGREAIFMYQSDSPIISYNNITTNSSNIEPFYIILSNNTLISNNNLTSTSTNCDYIYIIYSSNNTISNNNIKSYGLCIDTRFFYDSFILGNNMTQSVGNAGALKLGRSSNNLISNNSIYGTLANWGIRLSDFASNNTFLNNRVNLSAANSKGVYFESATTNNSFSGMNILTPSTSTSGVTAPIAITKSHTNFSISDSILNGTYRSLDFYIPSGIKGGMWNFTNVTMPNGSAFRTNWTTGSNGILNIFWYFNVNVSDSKTNITIGEANVTITDALGTYITSMNTSADGNISRQTLQQYKMENGSGAGNYTWYAPYNITIWKEGYTTWTNESVNVTSNTILNISLIESAVADTEYPQFTNYWDNNGTQTKIGTAYLNVTVTSTNGTVILTFDNTNYTASNSSGDEIVFNVTIENLVNGTYYYNWSSYGNGTSNLYNISDVLSYTILEDIIPPNIQIIFPSNNTNTSNIQINVNYTASDNVGLDSCWYSNDSGKHNNTLTDCGTNITGVTWIERINNITLWANDTSNNVNKSYITFTVDTIAPIVHLKTPINMTNTSSTGTTTFTYSITDYNGVWPKNATITIWNSTLDNIYNHTITYSGVSPDYESGTMYVLPYDGSFIWNIYGCDFVNNCNWSDNGNFTILKDTTPPFFSNSTPQNQTLTYGDGLSYYINASDGAGLGISCFTVNDTNFDINCTGYLKNITLLRAGLYWLNISVNDTLNNLNSTIMLVNVTKATSQTSLTFDKTSPQVYGTAITPTCSIITGGAEALVLTNGTSGLAETLGVGNWTFNCSYDGNENYTASSNFSMFNITHATASLGITKTTPIVYGTITDFTGTGCPSQIICSFNITNSIFSAGIISANYSTEGNENYTASSVTDTIIINQAIPEGTLSSTNTWTLNYAQGTIIGVSESNTGDDDVTYAVHRDDVNVGTGAINLSVGTYTYKLNTTGGTNWTSNSSMNIQTLIINKITSEVNLSIGNLRRNNSVNQNTPIDLNCSALLGDYGTILTLYNNGTLINQGVSPIGNTTTFSNPAIYNITCIYSSSINFTQSSETWWLKVNDSIPPNINITYPINNTNTTNAEIDINYTISDNIAVDSCWYSNDTYSVNFSLGGAGICDNITNITWSLGQHNITIWTNDSSGNENYSGITFGIEAVAVPVIPPVTPSDGGGGGIITAESFYLDKYFIDMKVKQGERERETILINNTGNKKLEFNLSILGIDKFAVLSEQFFTLSPKESKEITVYFFASENEPGEIYTGRIIFNADSSASKSVNVILEIKERFALFDIKSELENTTLTENQKLKVKINMTEVGDLNQKVDVTLQYYIKDFNNRTIRIGEETIGVYKLSEIEREFIIPSQLAGGDYLFYIKLNYLNFTATSSNSFFLVKGEFIIENLIFIISAILIGLLILRILLTRHKEEKKREKKRKKQRHKIKPKEEKKEKTILLNKKMDSEIEKLKKRVKELEKKKKIKQNS